MKTLLGLVLMLVLILSLPAPSHAAVGLFKWATDVYHSGMHALNVPVDVVEYATGTPLHKAADAVHFVAAKADYYVDEANGEDPAVKAARAQAKAMKKAKAAKAKR